MSSFALVNPPLPQSLCFVSDLFPFPVLQDFYHSRLSGLVIDPVKPNITPNSVGTEVFGQLVLR